VRRCSSRPPAATATPPAATDPWLLTTDGIGPYRLGERLDAMAGGDPGVHSAQGDRVGDLWSTVESRRPDGGYLTGASGARVMVFQVNPIRPGGVGACVVGLADHTQATFLSRAHC
jgi:hypothetical protein